MKILHLCTTDINGGAAKAAYRLHMGLREKGINSQMLVRNKYSDDEYITRFKYQKDFRRINYLIYKKKIESDFNEYKKTKPENTEVFSDDRSALKIGFLKQLPETDICNLHWISGFVDIPSFFNNINKPVVWTLHDMNPFTGGCHYNSGCDKYKTYCFECPQLGSKTKKDLAYQIWKRKHKALSEFKNKIIIRADSFWLAEEARSSRLFREFDIDTIHYGIETDEFVPRDKNACRKAFNIPVDKRVILFGAPGIDNPRKGFKQLERALHLLEISYPNLFLLSFGTGNLQSDLKIPWLHLGHVANNHILSVIYNCADIFVIPSLQEAFGQTALEAMSCGVPVAGFNTGGIPDMITDGITGYLAETGNIKSLAEAIATLLSLDKNDYAKMSSNCREKVINGFTMDHQAKKYIKTYKELL